MQRTFYILKDFTICYSLKYFLRQTISLWRWLGTRFVIQSRWQRNVLCTSKYLITNFLTPNVNEMFYFYIWHFGMLYFDIAAALRNMLFWYMLIRITLQEFSSNNLCLSTNRVSPNLQGAGRISNVQFSIIWKHC